MVFTGSLPCASTEPRPRGRGESARRFASDAICLLQRSHDLAAVESSSYEQPEAQREAGFNGATTSRPWRVQCRAVDRGRRALQRSHDLAAVERVMSASGSVEHHALQRSHDLAAVESPPGAAGQRSRCVASTEPRPRGRGERAGTPRCRWPSQWLQRSHDLAAVESQPPVLPVPTHPTLQRSHDLAAVERQITGFADGTFIASTEPRPRGRGEPPRAAPRRRA